MAALDSRQTEWNLIPLLSGDTDPSLDTQLEAVRQACQSFASTWKDRNDYLSDPTVLREALDQYERLNATYGTSGNPGYYFSLRSAQDLNNPTIKAREGVIDEMAVQLLNGLQFFENSLSRLDAAAQESFLAAVPLAPYRHFLERLFAHSRHLLSDAEETIMNLKHQTSRSNWVRLTSGLLAKEEREVPLPDGGTGKKGLSDLATLTHSDQKAIRDAAAEATYDIVARHLDVAEAEINSLLADKQTGDKLRGYERPESSRHLADDIDTKVVDAMVSAVSARYDLSRRFYALRATLTGQKTLGYHERLVDLAEAGRTYTYEEAATLVDTVFSSLDPEFSAIYRRMLAGGQVDVYPRTGKRSGAFCSHNLLSQPSYVLLNFTGESQDIRTIAHEFGHAINNELIREKQNSLNFGTPTSTAEVASTFMEDFVRQELSRDADETELFWQAIGQLDDEMNTIFRQTAAYQFEQELHASFRKAGYLSAAQINALFASHMQDYLGEAITIEEGAKAVWASWHHFRSHFYVYSYASGLLISKALQRRVKENPAFLKQVKVFLSAGLSASPATLFKELGLDIADPAFWDSGLEEIASLLSRAEDLARRLGKA